jgi:small subunit ribosomal protein S2e
MADRGGAAPARGGGFGSRGGDRGRGRGRGRGRRGGKSEEKEWQPVTKLGRLVKAGKINSMEEIYLHSLPIKEYQIVDNFLPKLKDEVMKVRLCFSLFSRLWGSQVSLSRFESSKGNEWREHLCSTMIRYW